MQNNKALVGTKIPQTPYFELTYNGDKEELYLDAYDKYANVLYPKQVLDNFEKDNWEEIAAQKFEEFKKNTVPKTKIALNYNVVASIMNTKEFEDVFFEEGKVSEDISIKGLECTSDFETNIPPKMVSAVIYGTLAQALNTKELDEFVMTLLKIHASSDSGKTSVYKVK